MEKLLDLFYIRPGDIVSVIGAGGKTTLVYGLAAALRSRYPSARVLVTTTTKMLEPDKNQADYIWIDCRPIPEFSGVHFAGNSTGENQKYGALDGLKELASEYDFTLIEADGANRKLLKGWAEHEPVIVQETTKTIGVLNLELIGKPAMSEDIHRLPIFLEIAGASEGKEISADMMIELIKNPDGMFKNAVGQRILYVVTAGNIQAGLGIFDYARKEAITCVLL